MMPTCNVSYDEVISFAQSDLRNYLFFCDEITSKIVREISADLAQEYADNFENSPIECALFDILLDHARNNFEFEEA